MSWFDRFRRRPAAAPWPACRDLMARLTDFIEGAMTPAEEAQVHAHLSACDGCTEAVEQFRMTIAMAGSLSESDIESLAPALRDDLLAAFRQSTD